MRQSRFNPFRTDVPSGQVKTGLGLEWEEGVSSQSTQVQAFDEDKRTERKIRWPKWLLLIFCLVLGAQLFNLQVLQGKNLRALAEGNRLRLQTILAPRGFIEDRNGDVIAKNTASFNLAVTPVDLPKDGRDEIFNLVNQKFGVGSADIEAKLKSAPGGILEPIIVKRNLTQNESIQFEVLASKLPGFSLVNIPVRDYVSPEVFSHLLGYTGIISGDQFQSLKSQNYDLNDFIGKSGIEQSYEKYLRGTNGNKQVEVDSTGMPIKELGEVQPEPGNIVQLNIDAGLQKKLYDDFTASSVGNKGAAIAINPKTGEVLALVSVPGFNNNLFAPGIKTEDYQALVNNKYLPLFNRAIAGTYPPGSTIKTVGAAAALQEGVITPKTIINDNGLLVIPNQFNPSVTYNFYGWKHSGLGPMDVRSAIAQSSDIYFYTVAGGHPSSNIKGLGAEKLAEYYRKFGMGALTGIDIEGEKTGRVADPTWKTAYYKDDALLGKWYLGDTYHIAIGQGDMLATPLQVAVWTAAIANDGMLNKPRLVNQVVDQTGKVVYKAQPENLIDSGVSLENIKVVQEGMRDNVASPKGSGRALDTLPISAAGKTGTSQFDGSDPSKTHAWYTAYAPYEDPQIVVTVLVEAGGEGHAAALPIVKNAIEWWAKNRMGK